MKFYELATSLERINALSSRIQITRELADLFKQTTPDEIAIVCNICLGQLNPPYIGTKFNIAEKSMMYIISEFLGRSIADIKPEITPMGDIGEFVAATYMTIPTVPLTITQVYEQLCVIEQMQGQGSQERKATAMIALLNNLDPISAKYVVRIVVGKLRLGFSDMTIIDGLSWMIMGDKSLHQRIEEAYNLCADIGLIASHIKKGGIELLDSITITLGIPIRPAAAERLPTPQAVIEKIGACVAQPKFDGFRLQVHVDQSTKKPRVKFFSRHLQDMSDMFPDLIMPFAQLDVTNCIVEGEAIGYNMHTNEYLPFQETVKRKRKHEVEPIAASYPLRVFIFDILYLNGESLLSQSHEVRRAQLVRIIPPNNPSILITPEVAIHSAQELTDYFFAQVETGLEGLVIKKPQAPYQAGKRNFNWIKLKRTSQGHIEDTIDVVVLGYYYGTGKRALFGIGAFLVGVYNKKKDCFQTIAKVGTGLKDDEWRDLKKRCDELKVKEWLRNVECAPELVPDVLVTPDIVCAVLADEITLSPIHTAYKTEGQNGFALRFPRFIMYRLDKGPQEATEVTEVKKLYEHQFSRAGSGVS